MTVESNECYLIFDRMQKLYCVRKPIDNLTGVLTNNVLVNRVNEVVKAAGIQETGYQPRTIVYENKGDIHVFRFCRGNHTANRYLSVPVQIFNCTSDGEQTAIASELIFDKDRLTNTDGNFHVHKDGIMVLRTPNSQFVSITSACREGEKNGILSKIINGLPDFSKLSPISPFELVYGHLSDMEVIERVFPKAKLMSDKYNVVRDPNGLVYKVCTNGVSLEYDERTPEPLQAAYFRAKKILTRELLRDPKLLAFYCAYASSQDKSVSQAI